MASVQSQHESRLLDYLPAIYREGAFGAAPSTAAQFLGLFLLAFEKVLLGRKDGVDLDDPKNPALARGKDETSGFQGLEEKIARRHFLFDPYETPKEFLTWLAGWAALSLHAGLSVPKKRKLVANIIPLYRIRGCRKYLQELLALHLDAMPLIEDEELPALQVGKHATVGKDTYIGGGPPHFFRVILAFPQKDSAHVDDQRRLAHIVIELAKPAHTNYELEIIFPRMQVGVHSRVGFDTVLAG